mmetsp:Transcript_30016/g.73082  ORF Transcript_30016/g.73082 Transcript_30016/m.73082 type:complete len:629 (-) Transcript_30016:344-2230(-)
MCAAFAPRSGTKGKTIGPYILGRPLGFGTTSRVHLAIHSGTKAAAAIKIIRKKPCLDLRKLQREISILRLLDHRYITRLYDVFESKNHIYMVMELVDGGELFDHIIQQKRLRRYDALRVFRQVAQATAYFHAHGIVHRDIKPENILVNSTGDIKIADFGFAIARKDGCLKTSCGSPHYACPEVCSSSTYDGTKADSWSLGVLLFVLITGDFPFNDQNYGALFHRIQTGKYMIPGYVDQDIADLITRLLTVDPDARLTVDGILKHSCMRPFDFKNPKLLGESRGDRKRTQRKRVRKDSNKEPNSPKPLAAICESPTNLRGKDLSASQDNVNAGMEMDLGASDLDMTIEGNEEEVKRKEEEGKEEKEPDDDGIPLVHPPLDQRAIQELLYLGWGETPLDIEESLLRKRPRVSPSIRIAYHSLMKKFDASVPVSRPSNDEMTVRSARQYESPSGTPPSTNSKIPPSPACAKFPPPVLPERRLYKGQGNKESTAIGTDSTKRDWAEGTSDRCGTHGRRRRWGGGENVTTMGSGSRASNSSERSNILDQARLELCSDGTDSAVCPKGIDREAASAERNEESYTRQQSTTSSSSGPIAGRRVQSEPMKMKNPAPRRKSRKPELATPSDAACMVQ